MRDKKKLLQVRKAIKGKKPEFNQQDSHKKKRVEAKWRRPRGLQSKMRHQFRGYSRSVKQGWRSPIEVRGLHPTGYETVIIHNVRELADVRKDQAIIIASTVGNKKRLEIITKAEELKLPVLNIKVDKFKAKIAKAREDKQKEKEAKTEKKKKTIEDSLKKAEKKEKDKEKASKKTEEAVDANEAAEAADEAKAEEKKIKDDILIHKEA
jgi:large subunit ribosomal protein L32e